MKNKQEAIAQQAQRAIDKFTTKVVVTIQQTEDGTLLCGNYHDNQCKAELMDRYFTSVDIFVNYFKGRADWLNATSAERAVSTVHPQMYKA